MPCSDSLAYDKILSDQEKKKEKIYLDHVTRLLCETLDMLESNGMLDKCSKEVIVWKRMHDEQDRLRRKR